MLYRTLRLGIAAALGGALALSACARESTAPSQDATVFVRADLSGTAAVTVVVEVAAPDITPTLVFNIPVVSGVASGTITIPVGSGRVITMRGFDASGTETHRGTVTMTVQPGTNPTVTLILTPLTGDVPIVATMGSITVTVTLSPSSTVPVNQTLTATAAITSNGTTVPGATPIWATLNPGVASVSNVGLVTGVAAGQTKIVATYQGVAGEATITVAP